MECYNCKKEMCPITDTAWRNHLDAYRTRTTEFFCPDCKIWIALRVTDYSGCIKTEVEE